MKFNHQLTPYTKINSKWVKDLNISCNTIKVLEENLVSKISDITHSNIFTAMSPRQGIKERIMKGDFIKIKSFCMVKKNISKMKREPTIWENIFANDTLDNGLISKMYKELSLFTPGKQKNAIKKWSKRPE